MGRNGATPSNRAADLKKLFRSTTDTNIAGVFGGLGEFFEVDPNIFRLAAVFLGISTGVIPLLVTYLVAWFVIPQGAPAYK